MRFLILTFITFVSLLSDSAYAKIVDLTNAGNLSGAWYIENPEDDQIDAYLIIKSGEFDATGTEGMCHFLEHLVWHHAMGGGSDGKLSRDTNAYTTGTSVIYFLAGDKAQLDENLRVLARVFQTPQLPPKFMQEEREIVHQEYLMRDSEWPWLNASSDFENALYGPGRRARSIIGHPDQILNFSIDEAMQLHALTHQPRNAALVMIGNLPEANVRESYRRHFTFKTEITLRTRPPEQAKNFGAERMVVAVQGIPSGRFIFAKRIVLATPSSKQHLSILVEILADILQSTRAGSLVKPMRYDSFIASWIEIGFDIVSETEITFRFSAEPDIGVSLNHLQATFESEMKALSEVGVPAATFSKIVAQKRKSLKALESKRKTELSLALGSVYLDAAPVSIEAYDLALASVRLEDVNAMIQAFAREGRTVMMYANQKVSP